MSFGLKNIGATYQREMVTMFHDLVYKSIEVYDEDILVESNKKENHLKDLRFIFERMG